MAVNAVTLLDGTVAYAHDVEDKVNPLYTDIDNTNIAAGAGILFSKLDSTTVMGVAAIQNVTGAKTFLDSKLLVGGLGAGVITLVYATSGSSHKYTMPDAGSDATFVMTTGPGNTGPIPPIGSIIAFYNYGLQGGGAPAIDLDLTYYQWCDGRTGITFGDGVVRDLPDLSNRYLVGFGTEAGGDIDSAAWDTTAVGAASHTISLTHQHANTFSSSDLSASLSGSASVSSSTTNSQSTTNSGYESAHTHSTPNHVHNLDYVANTGGGVKGQPGGVEILTTNADNQELHASSGTNTGETRSIKSGTTNSGGSTTGTGSQHLHDISHTHGVPSQSASVSVSGNITHGSGQHSYGNVDWVNAAQSIQPRSIKVRWIMRIK